MQVSLLYNRNEITQAHNRSQKRCPGRISPKRWLCFNKEEKIRYFSKS